VQAALASAASFAAGALLPVLMALAFAGERLVIAVTAASLVLLAALGAIGAQTGGASIWRGAVRVTFWGALAMGVTAGIGATFGAHT
jgi:VIT1/CCC1 family predicted Fe2+/Mn2+ transporter